MRQRNFKIGFFLTAMLFIASFGVQAASGDWYVGLGYGLTSYDTGISNTTGTANLDEDDSGFKLFGGYNFNKNVAIELAYTDLGEASLSGNPGDTFVLDGILWTFISSGSLKIESSLLSLAGVFTHHFNNAFSLYGRLGLASWEADLTANVSGGPAQSASEDGTDLFFGVGAGWNFAPTWALKAEYELYSFDDAEVDVNMLSLNIVKSF